MEHRRSMCYKFYNDYMQIAENNTKIAISFLKKAYTISEADEKYIKANKPKKDGK